MKTRIKKVGFVLLCLLIFGSQHKVSADAQSAKVEFQVEQKINGVEPSTMKYCYELQALVEMNPMPSGSESGKFLFTLTGQKSPKSILIEYADSGIYTYALKQVVSADSGYIEDKTKYQITVYVTKQANGLNIQMIVENDAKEKCSEIVFKHNCNNSDKKQGITGSQTHVENAKTQDEIKTYALAGVLVISGSLLVLTLIRKKRKDS